MASSVVAATVLLAAGAVGATYAALSSSSRKAVSRPPSPVAQVQAATPTAPAAPSLPATPLPRTHRRHHPLISRSPTIPVPKPGQRLKPTKPVSAPKVPKVTVPKAPNPTPATGPAVGTGPRRITLDTDAASIYNPYAVPLTRFGDPASAIDSDPTTAWTVQADSNGRLDSGLAIDLKSPHKVRALRIQGTRGITVQIYGSPGAIPTSITDPAWIHLGTARLTRRSVRVALRTGGKRVQGLALWLVTAPPGSTVKIAEVAVLR